MQQVWGGDSVNGTIRDVISGKFGMKPERALLITAYCQAFDSENEGYSDYNGKYVENIKLDTIYTLFENLGYTCSDEEIAWRTGKHELYVEESNDM